MLHSSGCTEVMPLPVKISVSDLVFVTLSLLNIDFEITFHYSLKCALKEIIFSVHFQYKHLRAQILQKQWL